MSELLKLVKQMCDQIVEATQKEKISVDEAHFRLSMIETVVGDDGR